MDKRHYEKFADGTVKDIEDEIPFDIPDGWSWCRFSEATKNRDSERKPVNSSNRKDIKKIYDYYGATGVIDKVEEYLFDEKLLLIGEDGANLLSHTKNNAFIAEGKYWVNNHAHVIDCFDKLMLDYICHYINSLLLDEYITGSAQPKLTQKALNDLLLPLPPLAEQQLIVEEIEKIFAQIDLLEQNKTDLQTAIKQAKSKILDLAIHGKLVPQDPNDEPASVLLEKIRAEKEEKINKGELKRDKNDSFIYKSTTDNCHYEKLNGKDVCIEDELPFSIPENWQWCRLKKVCSNFIVPQRDKPKVFNGTIPWCRIEDIEGKYLNGSLSNQLVTEETIKEMNMHICPAGSVICSCSASIGVQAITTVACCTNQTFIGIVPIIFMLFTEYLFYFLKAQTKYFHEIATGTTIKYISREKFEELFIPLPPLSEQKRIVAKIEELFSLLDQIQTNIV